MCSQLTKYFEWAKEDWKDINFGDTRLNNRAVLIGADFFRNPYESPPKMLKTFKKIKAFYRFMNAEKVTHDKLISNHINQSRKRIPKHNVILAIQDTTTMTFKRNYEIKGLYDVGNIPGLLIHNTISVIPDNNYGLIDGLLHQIVYKRKPKQERTEDDNEIRLWIDSIKEVPSTENTSIIDVMDRGADAIEIMHCSLDQNHEFLIRAQHNRLIDEKSHEYLHDFARALPTKGYNTIKVQGNSNRKKRMAKLRIAYSKVNICKPKNKTNFKPIECNIIHVLETNSLGETEPLEWFLLTSLEINDFEDAKRIIDYYSYRWIVDRL